jgi:hypothetical protein
MGFIVNSQVYVHPLAGIKMEVLRAIIQSKQFYFGSFLLDGFYVGDKLHGNELT